MAILKKLGKAAEKGFEGGTPVTPGTALPVEAGVRRFGGYERITKDIEEKLGTKTRRITPAPTPPTITPTEIGALPERERVRIEPVERAEATRIEREQEAQARAQQQAVMEQLQRQMRGEGPSVAEQQLRAGMEANIAAQMATMATARGPAQPAMARAAMREAARQRGTMAREAATARLQEQMAATGMAGQLATGIRGQDIGIATAQARLQQETRLANMQTQLRQAIAQGQITAGEAGQIYQAEVGRVMQQAQMQQAAQMAQAGMGQQAAMATWQAQQAEAARAAATRQAYVQSILAAGGQIGAAYATGGASAAAAPAAAAATPATQPAAQPTTQPAYYQQPGALPPQYTTTDYGAYA